MQRRSFLTASTFSLAGAMGGLSSLGSAADAVKKPAFLKAVKYGMIGPGKTPADKFRLLKKLGFQGVEIDSPSGLDLDAVVKATKETGIIVHGVIDSVHWRDTLSDPNEKVRAKGLAALRGGLKDAQKVGATTCLLVPGVVKKGVTFDQCWERSTAEIRKALPDAEKAGVQIAIEVVWNNFLTTPEQLVKYIDQFGSKWVGAYFDVSNMLKYGVPAATWIRKLGKRMLKFDFKGYRVAKGDKKGAWVGIGEGSEDWPEVRKALGEIGYNGWATAEVKGGDEKWLKEVSSRMDRILGLK